MWVFFWINSQVLWDSFAVLVSLESLTFNDIKPVSFIRHSKYKKFIGHTQHILEVIFIYRNYTLYITYQWFWTKPISVSYLSNHIFTKYRQQFISELNFSLVNLIYFSVLHITFVYCHCICCRSLIYIHPYIMELGYGVCTKMA